MEEAGADGLRNHGARIEVPPVTEVHLIMLCPDSAGHPSRDGILLIVGVQVFRLELSIYPSLTPGGHNRSYLWLKMKYLILNFTPDNAYLYASVHPLHGPPQVGHRPG